MPTLCQAKKKIRDEIPAILKLYLRAWIWKTNSHIRQQWVPHNPVSHTKLLRVTGKTKSVQKKEKESM